MVNLHHWRKKISFFVWPTSHPILPHSSRLPCSTTSCAPRSTVISLGLIKPNYQKRACKLQNRHRNVLKWISKLRTGHKTAQNPHGINRYYWKEAISITINPKTLNLQLIISRKRIIKIKFGVIFLFFYFYFFLKKDRQMGQLQHKGHSQGWSDSHIIQSHATLFNYSKDYQPKYLRIYIY